MEYVYRAIDFIETHPVVVLAFGVAFLLVFLYKHPMVFFVLAVLGVAIYLVFSLSSVGTTQKKKLIKKSASPRYMVPVRFPLVILIDKDFRLP